MDRLSPLRSAWMAPLVAVLLLAGLYWAVRTEPPRISHHDAPMAGDISLELDGPAAPSSDWDAAARWLPALGERSRALLNSGAFTRLTSVTLEEGPILNSPRSLRSEAPQPVAAVRQPAPGTRLRLLVPEPELLPDGTTGSGEPIPPRLSQRSGPPSPASESVPLAPSSEPPLTGPASGLLGMPANSAQRSQNLELIAAEADTHTRHGFELAGRGACFSARAEFITALRMLAQALDSEAQTNLHSQALATGLTALREADDFLPNGAKLEADLDLPGLVARHRTPVLQAADPATLTPMTALQCYLTFAQEQLAAAAGHEVAGSMALRGLGKLHEAMAERKLQSVQVTRPKAMAFYQAALLACPENYLASNDLGVLLARNGRLEDARVALEHSLSIRQQTVGWRNLATVYHHLGRADWAQVAQQRFAQMQLAERNKASGRSEGGQTVQWFDPQTFAQTGSEKAAAPALNPSTGAPLGLNAPRPAAPEDPHVAQTLSPNASDHRK